MSKKANLTKRGMAFIVAFIMMISMLTTALPSGLGLSPYDITINISPTGGGTVHDNIGGVNVPHGTIMQLVAGTPVSLTATANVPGHRFVGWFEVGNPSPIETNANLAFSASADIVIEARFVRHYTISVSAATGGTASIIGNPSADFGGTVTVSASANTGFTFAGWYEGGIQVSTSNPWAAPVTGARSLQARFNQVPIPPSITTAATLPVGTVNMSYSVSLAATGTAPITWSLVAPSTLPAGLSLSSGGVISGTPTVSGSFTFTIRASNDSGANQNDRVFNLTIQALQITTASLHGSLNANFNQTLVAVGRTPVDWTITGGTLPVGLSLNGATGLISGIPANHGSFTITVRATSRADTALQASRNITITIDSGMFITTHTLPGATLNSFYDQTINASGAHAYIWTIVSGSLPQGLYLDRYAGIISGTPTRNGTFNFTVRAANAEDTTMFAQRALSIVVSGTGVGTGTAVSITTTSLPAGHTNNAYRQTLAATGASSFTWSIASGSLPPGLSLASTTGVISGTPTTTGTFTFTLRATNAANTALSGTRQFTVVIHQGTFTAPPSVQTTSPGVREEVTKAAELNLIPSTLLAAHVDLRSPITREEFAAVAVRVFEALSGTTAGLTGINPFVDTNNSYVLRAFNAGIMVGVSPTHFAPDSLITREQAATALTRVYKRVNIPFWTISNDRDGLLSFTQPVPFADDARISDWARESVYFMVANRVILGTGANMFTPSPQTEAERVGGIGSATREQALLMALRMVLNLG